MLGPCRSVAVSTIRGIYEEMNLTSRSGGVRKRSRQSRAVHTKIGRATIGNGGRHGISLHNHGLGGLTVTIGGHQIDGMFGSVVGGRAAGVAGDDTRIGID